MRTLKIVPIVHSQAETVIPYGPLLRERTTAAWRAIEPAVEKCYAEWKDVQIYADGFAIPEEFKDPEMTPEKYKTYWVDRLVQRGSPLAKLVKRLVERGAILESTEINEKSFWEERYMPAFREAIRTGSTLRLDELDRLREAYISKRISQTLRGRGLLLIGMKHLGKFEFAEDIKVINP